MSALGFDAAKFLRERPTFRIVRDPIDIATRQTIGQLQICAYGTNRVGAPAVVLERLAAIEPDLRFETFQWDVFDGRFMGLFVIAVSLEPNDEEPVRRVAALSEAVRTGERDWRPEGRQWAPVDALTMTVVGPNRVRFATDLMRRLADQDLIVRRWSYRRDYQPPPQNGWPTLPYTLELTLPRSREVVETELKEALKDVVERGMIAFS